MGSQKSFKLMKNNTMGRLQDKVAIVTGGAKGIGLATVKLFLSEGAKVAIWDIDEAAAKGIIAELETEAQHIVFHKVDTSDLTATQDAAAKVQDHFGRLDILVNNAGITRDASLKKMTDTQWQQVIDVNLTGVFNCAKAVYPYMAEQGGGRILNAASVVALYGNFGQSNYVAAKAGVIGMTKVWAREFGRKGITVNAIAPGFINTDMMSTVPENILDGLRAKTPLGRLGESKDIANAYLFLASDEAAFITGTTLSVDGGLVL
jgi:3-oxoacyl-[acyl-carrier protein] reductase